MGSMLIPGAGIYMVGTAPLHIFGLHQRRQELHNGAHVLLPLGTA